MSLTLELEHKAYWLLKSSIMISNLPVRIGYLTLAHLMNERHKIMKMPSYLKKKLKDGMTKESKSGKFKVGEYVLLYNSRFRFFAGELLSKWKGPYITEDVYRFEAIKIKSAEGTNLRVVNGQRIKNYISGMPINIDTNLYYLKRM